MNDKEREKLLKKAVGSMKQTEIEDNMPLFEDRHINSVCKEILRCTNGWLSNTNSISIFLDYVFKGVEECIDDENKFSGNYQDLIGEERLRELAEELVAHVEGIPYTYEFKIPLSNVEIDNLTNTEIGNGVYLIKTEEGEGKGKKDRGLGKLSNALLNYGKKLLPNTIHLQVETIGYYGGNISDSACISALSSLKQIIQIAIYNHLITAQPETTKISGAFGKQKFVPNNNIHGCYKGDTDIITAILPIHLSMFLERLVLNNEYGLVDVYIKKNEVGKLFANTLNTPIDIVNASDANATPIQTALQWAFDAELSDNETISFIQICIGLESILGDERNTETLTATLSDRCAYLLGKGVKSRQEIAKMFRDMYKARSKLVHGRKVKLSKDEEAFLNWGKRILERVVTKEIYNYEH